MFPLLDFHFLQAVPSLVALVSSSSYSGGRIYQIGVPIPLHGPMLFSRVARFSHFRHLQWIRLLMDAVFILNWPIMSCAHVRLRRQSFFILCEYYTGIKKSSCAFRSFFFSLNFRLVMQFQHPKSIKILTVVIQRCFSFLFDFFFLIGTSTPILYLHFDIY